MNKIHVKIVEDYFPEMSEEEKIKFVEGLDYLEEYDKHSMTIEEFSKWWEDNRSHLYK